MATLTVTEAIQPQDTIELAPLQPTFPKNGHKLSDENESITRIVRPEDNTTKVTSEDAVPESEYPTGIRFWLIMLTIVIVLNNGALDANMIAIAVPSLTDHFHTVADVGWYSAANRLTTCACMFLFGKLYTLYPVQHVFLASLAIRQLGTVLSATAPSSTIFVVGRAVSGVGSGATLTGCFLLLNHVVPLRRRPLWIGILTTLEGVAAMAAPILGGALIGSLGWRWCFYITIPPGVLVMLTTFFCLPDIRRADVDLPWREKLLRLDLLGNLFFLPSMTCLFIALGWAGTKYSWDSPRIIVLLVLFALLLVGFIYEQRRRGDQATLPLRIIGQRSVLAGVVFAFCSNGAGSVLDYYVPTYFQTVREYSVTKSGYLMLPCVAGELVGGLATGIGTTAVGYYVPFMLLAATLFPIAAGLMTTWSLAMSLPKLLVYAALLNFAWGIGYQPPQIAVQTTLPAEDAAMGLSIILFAQNVGPALFVSVAQTLFTNRLSSNLNGLVPGLDAAAIENMGLGELKAHLGGENLEKVLLGLNDSIVQTWYLPLVLCCLLMVVSLSMPWRSVKQKKS